MGLKENWNPFEMQRDIFAPLPLFDFSWLDTQMGVILTVTRLTYEF